MNVILETPIFLRYALLALLGAVVGGQLNRGIYRLAYFPRNISPWSPPPEEASARSWSDCLPIVGWWLLRREAPIHGRGFWIRPLLLELVCVMAFPWLYFWEIDGSLLPQVPQAIALAGPGMLHAQFLAHLVLMCLLLMATFIDFDEKTIPDLITVPGTLFALLIAVLLPEAHLPVIEGTRAAWSIAPIQINSPLPWLSSFDGIRGLRLACICYLVWLLALINYTWTTRHGLGKAFAYMFASAMRDRVQWIRTAVLALLGLALIGGTWSQGGERWQSLLTALIGMAGGGGLVWMVRIVASQAMGREAMGFGDVTLMAMIGALLGWQPAIMIFFMAPALGSLIAVVQAVLTGHTELAFGPYLCAATAVMVIWWSPIWNAWAVDVFVLGWFIPLVVIVCIALMGGMLTVWRFIKEKLLGWG